MSFFDHFTTLDTTRWGILTSGTGAVTVTDGYAKLNCVANNDAAAIYLKTKIDKTKAEQYWISSSASNINASNGPIWIATLINHSGGPVVANATPTVADLRSRCQYGNGNSIAFNYRTSVGGTNTWRTDNTWGVASGDAIHAIADDYYLCVLETDPTLGIRWAVINDTYTTANTWDFDQGMRLFALTDWVPWASIDTTDDLYLTLGWPVNNNNRTGEQRVEWVAYGDDQAGVDMWCNARDSGGAWSIKRSRSRDGKRFLPEDRTTNALAVGAGGAWDDQHVKPGSVIYDGTTYHMFYQGAKSGGKNQIGYATKSSPIGTFTKYVSNPIVPNSLGTTEDQIGAPAVVYDLADPDASKRWKMLYFGYDGTNWRTFYAYAAAPEGPWTKNGVALGVGAASSWDEWGTNGNYSIFHSGGRWVVYFSGNKTGTSAGWAVGRATGSSLASLTEDPANPIIPYGADAIQVITANINGRTASMASTAGFEADMPVIVDKDTTTDNYSLSRIRKVNTNTSLELYHALTGFPSSVPAIVAGLSSGAVSVGDVIQYGSEFFFYVTPFSFFDGLSGTYAAYLETTGLLRAPSLEAAPGDVAWDWLATPGTYPNQFGGARSLENPTTLHAPLTVYSVGGYPSSYYQMMRG